MGKVLFYSLCALAFNLTLLVASPNPLSLFAVWICAGCSWYAWKESL